MTDPGCHNTVIRAWESNPDGLPMYRTTKKLKKCKKMLKKWSKAHFGYVTRKIKKIKELLWKAEEDLVRTGDIQEVVRLKSELNLLIDREEQMWHQRSHVKWVQSGDQNTKFFHNTVTQRKRRNFIRGVRDEGGVWQNNEEVFSTLFTDYYTRLFTSSSPQELD